MGDAAQARPKLLLLHGNPGSVEDWARLLPLLSAVADVVAIDLPGFGKNRRTSNSAESVKLDKLAEHALAAADALGWREPIFLIGHSHGGGVAQTAAARYPDRVAGIVLIATLGAPAHTSYRLLSLPGASMVARIAGWLFGVELLRPLNRLILRAVMADIFAPEAVPTAKVEQELEAFAAHPQILLTMVQVTRGDPCTQLLAAATQIRCPTLFIHGAADALVPAACAQRLHDRIVAAGGRSQFHALPSAGHMLLDYQASVVAEIIRPLLNQSGSTTLIDGRGAPTPQRPCPS